MNAAAAPANKRQVPFKEPAPRRRVLIVSHVFPPLIGGGAPRIGQFARLLPEFGWDVTVLTGRHSSAALDRSAVDALAGKATIVEAWTPKLGTATRGKPAPRHGIQGVTRQVLRTTMRSVVFPDREVFWLPAAIAAGRRALREVHHDVVLATYAPATNLLVGRSLARAFRLPLVLDFRDLWSTLPMPIFPTRLHRAAAARLERLVVQAASKLIGVAPAMARDLALFHARPAEDAVSITNGFDPSDLVRVHDARAEPSRPFRLLYSGSIHAHYDLGPFWRALRALAKSNRIRPQSFRVEFVGNLALGDARAHGVEAFIDTSSFVAHDRVFEALARADALLLVETPGYYAQYGYAAKVFDYVLTGKPVVALVDHGGNTSRLLQELGVGYCAEPRDEQEILRRLEQVIALKDAPSRRVDSTVAPLQAFVRRHLTAKLASVLDEVVTVEPRGRW